VTREVVDNVRFRARYTYNAFLSKRSLTLLYQRKGNEHIVQFGFEGWWITDLSSYLTGANSTYTIEAIEDSELLLYRSQEELMIQLPAFERYKDCCYRTPTLRCKRELIRL
jgi:hypothetical protein